MSTLNLDASLDSCICIHTHCADLAFFTEHLPQHSTTVVRPAGCGHTPFLDRPKETIRLATEFLKTLQQQDGSAVDTHRSSEL